MDKVALKEFLQKKYENPEAFLNNVIFPVFGEDNYDDSGSYHWLRKHPEDQTAADNSGIQDILVLGSIYVEGSQLDLFDITVASKHQLANSRVGIQQLIRRIISTHSGAFMIFHYNTTERWDWRFTFCHKGESQLDSSDAKRYTFLLGPGQSCRTAAENFCKLGEKITTNGEFEMDDIIKAFDVEALSKEFFDKYKAQYVKFVEYMADEENGMRENFIDTDFDTEGLTDEEICSREEKPLRDYVKKLLGRIVFLHFIQKKGWLGVEPGKEWGDGDMDFMMNLFEKATNSQKDNFLDEVLEPIFEQALNTDRSDKDDFFDTGIKALPNNGILKIPYLNGGLFEREASDEPDSVFPAEYFQSLFTFLSQYNFTIDENDPNDAQVGIDPEMLGRIFENLLEDNKDKGAFYTPKEIVQYMCRESLIAYLQTDKADDEKQAIRDFVSSYDITPLSEELKQDIDSKLKSVKICDPAIGSGAFPMGLLKEIFYCRGAIENFDEAAEIKKDIIQNNIYGVDIEKGAVDIARLRFWLSIIVDEKVPHCLPNMDFKIMQGNSLIEDYKGIDLSGLANSSGKKKKKGDEGTQLSLNFGTEDVLDNIHVQMDAYYKLTDHKKKNEIREVINDLVRTYIKKYTLDNPEISDEIGALPIPNDKFFLWHTYFADVFQKGGFDIVIGNPPYIQLQSKGGVLGNLYRNKGFETYTPTGDIYSLFYEFGCYLLKEKAHLCFITSNKWMRTAYGQKTRAFISLKNNPKLLIDFAGMQIFNNATVETNILLIGRELNSHNTICVIGDSNEDNVINHLSSYIEQNAICYSFNSDEKWVILSSAEQNVNNKINQYGVSLVEWDLNIFRGVLSGYNNAYIVTKETIDSIVEKCCTDEEVERTLAVVHPIIRGRDIQKYHSNIPDCYLLWIPWHFPCHFTESFQGASTIAEEHFKREYPSLYNYFEQYKEPLLKRNGAETGIRYEWYAMQRWGSNFWQELPKNKIVWKRIGSILRFTYDTTGAFALDSTCFATGEHLEYLCCVLNSPMGHYLLKDSPKTGTGDLLISVQAIEPIKIPKPDKATENKIIALFKNQIISPSVENEREINDCIYSLYHLSTDEISLVEVY